MSQQIDFNKINVKHHVYLCFLFEMAQINRIIRSNRATKYLMFHLLSNLNKFFVPVEFERIDLGSIKDLKIIFN